MMKKPLKLISCAAVAAVMTLSSGMAVSVSADWNSTSSGYTYTNENDEKVTGWKTIDGKKYYFSKKGIAATGFKKINGKTYYFIKTKKGMMATGWYKVGNSRYYFGSDGVMRTGWKTIGGKKYYFGTDGAMATGTVEINGKKYSFNSDGSLKTGTSSSSSSGVNSVSLGMTRKNVISAAKLKNYMTLDLGDDMTALYVPNQSFFGVSKVEVGYVFDENDKLIGIMAYSDKKSSLTTWNSALKKNYKYNMSFSQAQVGMDMDMYYDDQNMQSGGLGFTASMDGKYIVVVTDINNLMNLSDSLSAFSENADALLNQ